MAHISNVRTWERRKQAMIDAIDFAQKRMSGDRVQEKEKKNPAHNAELLEDMLPRLSSFVDTLFGRFRVFFAQDQVEDPEFAKKYPEDYVYDTILRQAAFDLSLFEGARANGRPSMALVSRDITRKDVRDTLRQADRLASDALKLAENKTYVNTPDATPRNDIAILSAFQRSLRIRTIPYARTGLIGIPYTSIEEKRDFMAIPHEVGHAVYWLGLDGGFLWYDYSKKVHDLVPKAHSHIYRWREEIFADVYGTLVAGPLIVRTAQEIALTSDWDDFLNVKGEHPAPVIRPLIYAKALATVDGAESWATQLWDMWKTNSRIEENWAAIQEEAPALADIIEHDGVDLHPEDRPIDAVINECVIRLRDGLEASPTNFWSVVQPSELIRYENSEQFDGALFEKFDNAIDSQAYKAGKKPAALPAVEATAIVDQLLELKPPFETDIFESDITKWRYLLEAGGWTIKGPHGRH